MAEAMKFHEAVAKNLDTLEKYVPVVAKVHGASHPEFHEVRKHYDSMVKKIKESGDTAPDLTDEFAGLRSSSGNYAVPSDTCETYEAVYQMLAELDQAYHA